MVNVGVKIVGLISKMIDDLRKEIVCYCNKCGEEFDSVIYGMEGVYTCCIPKNNNIGRCIGKLKLKYKIWKCIEELPVNKQ